MTKADKKMDKRSYQKQKRKANLDGEQNKWTKSKFMSEQKMGLKNKKICSYVFFLRLFVTSIRITKNAGESVQICVGEERESEGRHVM